jgi:hypothetical protein
VTAGNYAEFAISPLTTGVNIIADKENAGFGKSNISFHLPVESCFWLIIY